MSPSPDMTTVDHAPVSTSPFKAPGSAAPVSGSPAMIATHHAPVFGTTYTPVPSPTSTIVPPAATTPAELEAGSQFTTTIVIAELRPVTAAHRARDFFEVIGGLLFWSLSVFFIVGVIYATQHNTRNRTILASSADASPAICLDSVPTASVTPGGHQKLFAHAKYYRDRLGMNLIVGYHQCQAAMMRAPSPVIVARERTRDLEAGRPLPLRPLPSGVFPSRDSTASTLTDSSIASSTGIYQQKRFYHLPKSDTAYERRLRLQKIVFTIGSLIGVCQPYVRF
ncbi:hypothetical protein BKA62DRAFT_672303 [Auriculariales sp. MPI-PUGE-AT-0066]|nr:hypothetical protein BKA62DRAFT_672303 [Auriculariales sp. MPI-PUGE-AT-0066]